MTWASSRHGAGVAEQLSAQRQGEYDRDEIVIGFVNNMPDGAFRATENQIRSLLSTAAPAGAKFRLLLLTLPQIARDRFIQSDIDERYSNANSIGEHRLDALIVSGAEPTQPRLENELYWDGLVALIEWARANTISAIWSCLACHAVVLHLDGIERQKYPQKLSGVYRCESTAPHPILTRLGSSWLVPHSRKNGLSESSLIAGGYNILSRLPTGDADTFVKDVGSLFVCLQGHPEYDRDTLLKEYRRDVHRYLDGTATSFPNIPEGYFDPRDQRLLRKLEELTTTRPAFARPDFPNLFGLTDYSWRSSAVRLYQGWLEWLVAQRAANSARVHTRTPSLSSFDRGARPGLDNTRPEGGFSLTG